MRQQANDKSIHCISDHKGKGGDIAVSVCIEATMIVLGVTSMSNQNKKDLQKQLDSDQI